ncbi:hypothetical protein MPTK1_1g28840 [Marchantia polymorpha subsp. ruderalis]|uniref:Uncharacterized protein n=2 Tax=Marchantia polymorpha TaxID=3197 RepID=A0AAF6AVC7_MARPO|nr:hypothetical protein MARPO_0107s0001 [Marchantia polymorpha]BBN00398.1 hypothetical protein Mp_1g28840 [Marchantia polymorpha subsp. ruderalis]|eukprot:PTQ31724.1 hypothetical protein MARPO_0107s0001 [Marchantia polymorpha]
MRRTNVYQSSELVAKETSLKSNTETRCTFFQLEGFTIPDQILAFLRRSRLSALNSGYEAEGWHLKPSAQWESSLQ